MRILLTGAFGFLGWHSRVRLELLGGHEVIPVGRAQWRDLPEQITGVDAIVHVAGVNRGTASDVEDGNIALARDLASALAKAPTGTPIGFANSVQAGNDTPYGVGKARASKILRTAAARHGQRYVDVRLPNLFGEHGRPNYNSFVATFIKGLITGEAPRIDDRPINLMHVQEAARHLLDAVEAPTATVVEPRGRATTVQQVFDKLRSFHQIYRTADVPPLPTELDVDLFNTLRAALFPAHYPIQLTTRSDHRGSLVEVVRAHGAGGQTFVSTSHPEVSRGDHFHVRKVERFAVLSGRAQINLRRLYDPHVVSFQADGRQPCIVDMPTLWAHNIINTGPGELTTLFWTNELFDPDRPDTVPHPVAQPTPVGASS